MGYIMQIPKYPSPPPAPKRYVENCNGCGASYRGDKCPYCGREHIINKRIIPPTLKTEREQIWI